MTHRPPSVHRQKRDRLLRYQATLLKLSARQPAEFGRHLREVLRADAEILELERVGYWVFDKDLESVRCVALYLKSADRFEDGLTLSSSRCPLYFRALKEDLVIAAANARMDPRTRALSAYLKGHDIYGLLDVPVWADGELAGVICHEHVGAERSWRPEEEAFALSIGQVVSTALEAERRRKTEKELEEREEEFLLLSRHAVDYSLVALDPSGRIHGGAERIRGFRSDELLGRHMSIFYPPEDIERGRPEKMLRDAQANGVQEEEGWLVRKDGTRFWAHIVLVPLWTSQGALRGFVKIAHDLTQSRLYREREALLENARRDEERQRHLAKISAVLMSSLDEHEVLARVAQLLVPEVADGCLIHLIDEEAPAHLVSAAAEEGGAEQEEALATLSEILADDLLRGEAVDEALTRCRPLHLLVEDPLESRLARGKAASDALTMLEVGAVTLVPMVARSRVVGILTLLHRQGREHRRGDLEHAHELGRRIASAVDNAHLYRVAQKAISVREEFLSIAAHELRTPLSALRLSIQCLQRASSDPSAIPPRERERLDAAHRQVLRLGRLVNELLEVSRIASGRLQLRPDEVSLTDLAQDTLQVFSEEAARAGCELVVDLEEGVTGWWDPLRLEQVLTNLTSNAIKFGAGRPVEISLRSDGELAIFSVRDHGIGISPGDRERIFRPFERTTGARDISGMGLGLYVTRQIVDAHRGGLEVESEVGRGSSFTVFLPRSRAAARPGEPAASPDLEPPERAPMLH